MPSFSSIKILFLGREIVLIYKGLLFQKVGYSQNTCDRMIHGRFVFERIEHHWRVCMDRDDHTERICIVLALRIVTGPLLNYLLVPICSFMFAFLLVYFVYFPVSSISLVIAVRSSWYTDQYGVEAQSVCTPKGKEKSRIEPPICEL